MEKHLEIKDGGTPVNMTSFRRQEPGNRPGEERGPAARIEAAGQPR